MVIPIFSTALSLRSGLKFLMFLIALTEVIGDACSPYAAMDFHQTLMWNTYTQVVIPTFFHRAAGGDAMVFTSSLACEELSRSVDF